MFQRLRAAFGAWLDAVTARAAPTESLAQMRETAIRARVAVEAMRESLQRTERELAAERKQLEDASRRGRLAAGIQDRETAEVAERFAARHRERVAVLERKLAAHRAELALAERDYEEMKRELRHAERARPIGDAARSADAAWRSVATAGGAPPAPDGAAEVEHLRSELDRRARERLADEQLQTLKQRMGRE